MKTKLFILSLALMFSFSFALAQADDLGVTAGTTPDSPFYFLDKLGEWFAVKLAFNPVKKAELKLKYAGERLAELKDIEEKGALNDRRAEKIKNSYENLMDETGGDIENAKQQGKDVAELVKKMEDLTARHTAVIEKVLEKVPEQAKAAIEKVLEKSKLGHERAIEAIQKEMEEGKIKAEELKEEVRERVKEIKERKMEERGEILLLPEIESEQEEIDELSGETEKDELEDIGGDISDLENLVR